MKTRKVSTAVFSTSMLLFVLALPTSASIVETWESQSTGNNPFNGTGDLAWSGDVAAWGIATQSWPTSPAQDFAGQRSIRSSRHGSTTANQVVETIVTNITSEVTAAMSLEWSVFFSGNLASIQPNRRADFILLSDTSSVGTIEDPFSLNGYKLTLNDPYFNATDNIPPSSHEGASLADSLTLWSVTASDDRWRVVGSVPITVTDDLRDGWNIMAQLDATGIWSIGFANGAIGQTPVLTSLGMAAGGPALSAFATTAYAGVGWTAPNNSTNDHTDFGFDNFSVSGTAPAAVPEPSTGLVLFGLILICWPAIASMRDVERD